MLNFTNKEEFSIEVRLVTSPNILWQEGQVLDTLDSIEGTWSVRGTATYSTVITKSKDGVLGRYFM